MGEQLSKVYDPRTTERQANEIWLRGGYFHAEPVKDGERQRKPYTIVIPPPNVTAALHLGHALNNTLQDILIRYHRMLGDNTLWMPGTDHAGIATQTVVEKRILSEEGKRRTDFERSEFIARVQAWKDEYEAQIIAQLKAMGCSCDWQRTRFTMDETCARAVRATFFKLFRDGLIYRGKRLVNWDPATQTVLADDEVEHETVQGHFWYMRYPLVEAVECGTAFQAVGHKNETPVFLYGDEIRKKKGAYLPHWTKAGATYAVAFRLADSMPSEILERWRDERDRITAKALEQGRELTEHEQNELARLYSDRVESYLDAGHGSCHLADQRIAEVIQDALKHFHGQRYELIAWAVMPNHVHVVVRPHEGIELSDILHSWKSYTAHKANELLELSGEFWRTEYYDHLIRSEEDFIHQLNYILSNPEKAGLEDWAWVGVVTDNVEKVMHGRDGRATVHERDAHATAHGQDARVTYVTVATTRPETMLGDTAVAMNPSDPRAKYLLGKKVRLPIVGRIIPIIADEHVVLPSVNNENDMHGRDAHATAHGQDARATFSTGFLKVTPAHDMDDWAIGQRHNLEVINVMAPDGSISDKYGWEDAGEPEAQALLGMDRFEAREAIVEWFRQEGLLEDVREYAHEVGHSYRSHVPIEPYLSDQWYIAVKKPIPWLVTRDSSLAEDLIEGTDVPVKSLAGLALGPLLDGRLRFIPERYAKTYQAWLENLRDWPISRQLWWGHRIPIWHKRVTLTEKNWTKELLEWGWDSYIEGNWRRDSIIVHLIKVENGSEVNSKADPLMPVTKQTEGGYDIYICPLEDKTVKEFDFEKFGFKQDEDVLDTWFSSALWPFSTLGWPEESSELKTFYPGDVLCTAREIITLWVSRMVMMGQYCVGDIPFRDVYIHAMIQDGQGRKMSKSLGNGIDPLVAIDSHGADAMRFTLASMTTDTQDIRMPVAKMTLPDGRRVNTSPKFDIGRNFCNKLWNASRFAMMNLDGIEPDKFDDKRMNITDRWILSRLARCIDEVTDALNEYKYNEPLNTLYRFFWNDFCDWYLEWVKPRMQDEQQKPIAQNVLAFVLDQTLRLLHPFVPFITEGIFQKLNEIAPVRRLAGISEAKEADALVCAEWPRRIELTDEQAEQQITMVQGPIRAVRDIKSKYNIAPTVTPSTSADAPVQVAKVLNDNSDLVCHMAGVKVFKASTGIAKPKNAAIAIVDDMQIYVHDVIDPEAERQRLEKQKEQIEKAKAGVEAKLGNENFVKKARPEVVAQAKERLGELKEQLETIEKHLAELGS